MPGTHGFYQRGTHGFFVRGSHGFRGAAGCADIECLGDTLTISVTMDGWAGTYWENFSGTLALDYASCSGGNELWSKVVWGNPLTPTNYGNIVLSRASNGHDWTCAVSIRIYGGSCGAFGQSANYQAALEELDCNSPNGLEFTYTADDFTSENETCAPAASSIGTITISVS